MNRLNVATRSWWWWKTPLLLVKIIDNCNNLHFVNKMKIITTTLYKTAPLSLDTIKFNYVEQMVKLYPLMK
ncbi:hypothetical protein [Spiroplasma endosymbiont of Polydrusus formosus]|uniref:hypothetical protein n=1 Tax=Spiroplasma endosymbiont of Polydrusus formosus TaxID=3139326 RepID=UPI0035B52540